MQDEQTDVEQRRQQVQINQLKAELEVMLKRPLLPAGFSPAYPTFGGHQVSIGTYAWPTCERLPIKSYSYNEKVIAVTFLTSIKY